MKRPVLLYRAENNGRWVAHSLRKDLVGTGDSPREAFEKLAETVEVDAEVRRELGSDAAPYHQAPRALWEALRRAVRLPAPAVGIAHGQDHELAIVLR